MARRARQHARFLSSKLHRPNRACHLLVTMLFAKHGKADALVPLVTNFLSSTSSYLRLLDPCDEVKECANRSFSLPGRTPKMCPKCAHCAKRISPSSSIVFRQGRERWTLDGNSRVAVASPVLSSCWRLCTN